MIVAVSFIGGGNKIFRRKTSTGRKSRTNCIKDIVLCSVCVCFVDLWLSFCIISFGHCVICSSIYSLWSLLWYFQTLLITLCCIEYTSPWTGFKLTALMVLGTDCTGSCTSNHHAITTTMTSYVILRVKNLNITETKHVNRKWLTHYALHSVMSVIYWQVGWTHFCFEFVICIL